MRRIALTLSLLACVCTQGFAAAPLETASVGKPSMEAARGQVKNQPHKRYPGLVKVELPKMSALQCSGNLLVLLDASEREEGVWVAPEVQWVHKDSADSIRFEGLDPERASGSEDTKSEKIKYHIVVSGRSTVSSLIALNVQEACSVKGKGLGSKMQELRSSTTGSVYLEGYVGLKKIVHTGKGRVQVTWLDTPILQLEATHGSMHFAGVVEDMRIRVFGDVRVDAVSVRAGNVWADVSGQSLLRLGADAHVNVYATEQGQVVGPKEPVFFNKSALANSFTVFESPFL